MTKFNDRNTGNLKAKDRVTLTNDEGDTVTVTISKIVDNYNFENSSGTVFKIGYSGGWTIQGVEFLVPSEEGLYLSKNGDEPGTVVHLDDDGMWTSAYGSRQEIDEIALLDLLPLFKLAPVGETVRDIMSAVHSVSEYKNDDYKKRDWFNKVFNEATEKFKDRS